MSLSLICFCGMRVIRNAMKSRGISVWRMRRAEMRTITTPETQAVPLYEVVSKVVGLVWKL